MKNTKIKSIIKSIIPILLVLITCTNLFAAKDTLVVKASIVCSTCKKTLEEGLRFEKGIKQAIVNVSEKTVTVIYNDDKTNPDSIRKAISKLGYDADSIPADKSAYEKLENCCKKDGHVH